MTHIPLQEWYGAWLDENAETQLLFVSKDSRGDVSLPQVHFVRDSLARLVWGDRKYEDIPLCPSPRDDCRESAWVIGEHRSKSVRLPVFSFERPDLGVQVVLRYNFHDWNVSVVSERPVEMDLSGYGAEFDSESRKKYVPKGYWGYLFFQGFPDEFMLGPHELDPRRFSLAPDTNHECYAFVRALMKAVRR